MPLPISCPRCHHVRQPHEQAPSWQCPACGVAYIKAAEDRAPVTTLDRSMPMRPETRGTWGRWLAIAAIAAIACVAYAAIKLTGHAPVVDLRTLSAATAPSDVVIYSTSWCPNCKAAKQWMAQQGFAFTECDVEASASCAAELRAHYGSSGNQGVPYLVVRGHHMADGFDSEEFIAALKRR
jgi:glutaredoxin